MSIFLSIIALLTSSVFACEISKNSPEIISLSGPVTVSLRELDLLKDKKLKGLSLFNPIKKDSFSGTIYPGGIFLSTDTYKDFEGKIVFFDEGRDMKRILSDRVKVKNVELRTRFLTPEQTIDLSLKYLAPYLVSCDLKIADYKSRVKKLQNELLASFKKKITIIFYLGEISERKKPELVIVNDGVVKFLRDHKVITTYPSRLSYVNWSSKIMNDLPKETLHIGLKDSTQSGVKEIKKSPLGMTLHYPGVLVPGFSQLEGFHYLLKHL